MPQTHEINFEVSPADGALIVAILARAQADYPGVIDEPTTLHLDLTTCHTNGCPLDLQGLLVASKFNFAHDVFGIANHMDRKTGKLSHHFLPRFAK